MDFGRVWVPATWVQVQSRVLTGFESQLCGFESQSVVNGFKTIGGSTSASVPPMNIQDWFPLGLTGLIPCSPRDSQEYSITLQLKSINSSGFSFLYGPTLTSIHDHWTNHSFDYTDLCQQSMSLLFSTLSRFVIVFLPRSKCLLIPWLQLPFAVILEPKKTKSVVFPLFLYQLALKRWDWMSWS